MLLSIDPVPPHYAKYSDALMPVLFRMLMGREKILDPFAGTGKLRRIRPDAYLIEIEPEWAAAGGATVGNALKLHEIYPADFFDGIATSCTYGNRMADHFTDHKPEKHYKRHTYTHALGRELNPDNSGKLQWGKSYRDFHELAWRECRHVLKNGGLFVLNISDHIRAGRVMPVTDWHISALEALGFHLVEHVKIETPRNGHGENAAARVPYESVIAFVLEKIT